MTDRMALVSESRRELARFPALLGAVVAELEPETWRARPAPREWAPVEIVCHLRDEEAEDFGARVRVVLARGDDFAPIDPERWAVERRYREDDPQPALAAFRQFRAESLALLDGVSVAALGYTVSRSSGPSLSGLDILAAWVTHDRLHLHQMAGTLARLWADRWAPLNTAYAGPIPYSLGAGEGA
jgi:hypothetical protein